MKKPLLYSAVVSFLGGFAVFGQSTNSGFYGEYLLEDRWRILFAGYSPLTNAAYLADDDCVPRILQLKPVYSSLGFQTILLDQ